MELKGSEATFSVNIIGNRTNDSYMGTFKVKCLLSPLEEIEADRSYRELLGVNSHLATEHVRRQAFALAQLEQRVIEYPPFWENDRIGGGHIQDSNVIMDVLDKAVEAQEKYVNDKKADLKRKQEEIAEMIRKKKIEKEPEINSVDEPSVEVEEVDLD